MRQYKDKQELREKAQKHVDKKNRLEAKFQKNAQKYEEAEERNLIEHKQKPSKKGQLDKYSAYNMNEPRPEDVDIKAFLAEHGLEEFYRPTS